MWFFQTAGNQDMVRLKKANFEHMGVIPQGIKFLTAAERFTPNAQLIQMAFARNRQLMSDSATSYTQEYDKGPDSQARTATETMAIVNSSQAMASGILEMGYTYEKFKYMEMVRRACLKNNTDPIAKTFRLACLKDGIPEDMLHVEHWNIEPEQQLGGGNKTLQMATVGFLNQIRQNLPPNGQRIVDHMSVEAATDQPDLAEEIAPLGETKPISNSMHDAELATERIMRGLRFMPPKDAVLDDYVEMWLIDLGTMLQTIMQNGGMTDQKELVGLNNMGQHIDAFLQEMAKNKANAPKVREYSDKLGQFMNHVKGLEQRLQESMKQAGGNGAPGPDPQEAAKAQSMVIQADMKAKLAEQSHTAKTAQRQTSWEMEEQRKNIQTGADIEREAVKTRHDMMHNRLKTLATMEDEPQPAGE